MIADYVSVMFGIFAILIGIRCTGRVKALHILVAKSIDNLIRITARVETLEKLAKEKRFDA